MNNETIYIVVEVFSDYGEVSENIVGVFKEKEKAEKLCSVIDNYDTKYKTKSCSAYIFDTTIGWYSDRWTI